jgi:S-adenosylmethionine decarboxylase
MCQKNIKQIIINNDAVSLGDQLYEFPNKSFSLLVSLVESHVSIHTWPERLAVQVDVFLCSYLNDNTAKCEKIYDDIVDYFDVCKVNTTKLDRL